eukprot:746399-Hanusia_phi.AAC.1
MRLPILRPSDDRRRGRAADVTDGAGGTHSGIGPAAAGPRGRAPGASHLGLTEPDSEAELEESQAGLAASCWPPSVSIY